MPKKRVQTNSELFSKNLNIMKKNTEFSGLRRVLFPIHRHELRKFIPLTSIFLIISFCYSMFRSFKDIHMLRKMGAESLYSLKVFGVTPAALLFTIIYSRISKATDRDTRFNVFVGYFLAFFGLSYFLFIPYLEVLQLDSLADSLNASFPTLKHIWETIRFWPFSLFYINAELWGTMVLSVLFWTFVNEITSLEQSKRFYGFLAALGAAIGLILSGLFLKFLKEPFNFTMGLCLGMIATMLVIYNIFSRDVQQNPTLYQVVTKPKKQKTRLSFAASLKFLAKSQHLALIAGLVLAYNVFISLFESVWKAKMKEWTGGDEGMLEGLYGDQGIFQGILALLLNIFLAAPIMKRGWRFAAFVTPTVALVATLVFFFFLYFQDSLTSVTAILGASALEIAVMCGLVNVVFIKSSKYVLFDPTKEQAYIPLDEESKIRGKAAVDGVGSRLGKSLGSIIVSTILVPVLGSISNARSLIFFLILIMLVIWLVVVNRLSGLLRKYTEEHPAEV